MLLSSIFPFYRNKISDFSLIFSLCLFILFASSTEFGKSDYDVRRAEIAQKYNGYDCGKHFFIDNLVSQAIRMASLYEGEYSPRPYVGPLYHRSLGYMTWPIALDENSNELKKVPISKIWHTLTYQVVFTNNGEVIDLLVMLTNHELAKCSRVDHSKLEVQYQDVENVKGYYCGSRFIPKDHLEDSANLARKYFGKERMFPMPYIGHLYREGLGYLIWPIYRGQRLYKIPDRPGSPYLIVLDPAGQIKDVIAFTNDNSNVKCMISTNTLPEIASNVENNANMKSTRSGFYCHGIFFDDEHLQMARDMAFIAWNSKRNRIFPEKYAGPPFGTPCLLWPIKTSGTSIRNGNLPPYRLVLSMDFAVMCVVIKSPRSMKRCERKVVVSGITDHDPNHYRCSYIFFSNSELLEVAKTACRKRNLETISYPRKFDGASFDVPGPYFIYPIIKGKKYFSSPGSNYMVMNYDCILAGAVILDKVSKQFRKCEVLKSNEGPELDGSVDMHNINEK